MSMANMGDSPLQAAEEPFLGVNNPSSSLSTRPSRLSSHSASNNPDNLLEQVPPRGYFRGSNLPVSILLIGCLVTLVASLSAIPLVNYLIESQVKEEVIVSDYNSPSFDTWVSNSGEDGLPITYDIYLFDIANYQDVLQKGAKPSLTQKGPYRYRETFTRHEVNFNEDGTEVSFYEQWTYIFDAAGSYPLHDSDEIVQANLVAMGLKEMVDGLDLDEKVKPNIDAIVDKIIPVHDFPIGQKLKNETERVVLKEVLHKAVDDVELAPLITKLAICLTSGTEGLALGPFHRKSARDLYFGYR